MGKLRTPVTENDHQTGNPKSKVTLVEYGDYQCSYCGAAYPLVKRLLKEHGQDLLFVFRNFPLQDAHPQAMVAALAAEAANEQGKFWGMHNMIYENQDDLSEDSLLNFAKTLGLNLDDFNKDWKSETIRLKVEADFESGVRSGVNGTPSFFINGDKLDSYDATYESLADAVGLLNEL